MDCIWRGRRKRPEHQHAAENQQDDGRRFGSRRRARKESAASAAPRQHGGVQRGVSALSVSARNGESGGAIRQKAGFARPADGAT